MHGLPDWARCVGGSDDAIPNTSSSPPPLSTRTPPQKKLQVKADEKKAYQKVKSLEVGKQMGKVEGLEADVRLAEGAVQVCACMVGAPFSCG